MIKLFGISSLGSKVQNLCPWILVLLMRGIENIWYIFFPFHKYKLLIYRFSSVAQSCPTLCNSIDCRTPGFPVHQQLTELAQTHINWIGDAIQPSHPLLLPSPALSVSQHHSFPMSWLFASGSQSFGASASFLPMNIQNWFPLGLTGLISSLSKGLSRVSCSTTVRKHQFSGA